VVANHSLGYSAMGVGVWIGNPIGGKMKGFLSAQTTFREEPASELVPGLYNWGSGTGLGEIQYPDILTVQFARHFCVTFYRLNRGLTALRGRKNSPPQRWMRALLVGVLLAGELHLFSAELLHHHRDIGQLVEVPHGPGAYLVRGQDLGTLCPLCQIARSGSVRPATMSVFRRPDQPLTVQNVSRRARPSTDVAFSLLARAPPLS
jgi:hypothetical protein